MDSISLIDKPSFWIAFGLAEIALPMVVPNKRLSGLAMLSLAAVSFAVAVGWSPSHIRPPRLAIFVPVALIGSVGVAISRRLASNLSQKRDASRLAPELEDWSILARARLPRFTSAAWRFPEEQQLDAEYTKKFGPRIVQLMKPLIAGDSVYTELRDTWLRAGSKTTLDVASSAHLASKFFEKYGNELPIPISKKWVDKAFVKSVTTYFAGALVLWSALFGLGKVVVNPPIENARNEPQNSASVLPNRHLTVAQADALIASLSRITFVHSVKVEAPNTDQDAWDYAAEFVYVFRKAGWTVIGDGIHPTAVPGAGITVLFGHRDDWKTSYGFELDAAFSRAQIEIHGRGVRPDVPNGQIEFAVGYND
jgi:hypothetical protein